LTRFFRYEGASLLSCAARAEVAWGLYAPYSALAAWAPRASERYKGFRLPQPATEALERFAADCIARGVDFQLVELSAASEQELPADARIVLGGSFYMSEAVQERLSTYVERGGVLVMLGESPLFDERLQSCEILQERVFGHQLLGRESIQWLPELGGSMA